ncbi:hypothetical protein ACCAA_310040 [Candidatus Accumulibacter aalborgensis]|uniref:Uncharacterized protein n=1 Tax=Candidatus Accumulibacter aalborgensis TaxID=1860102 RepID=A0A1A8XQQ0_9PROT|nr:hypothetical protein ACCAA_310040 [Candidatus Accumulibacter aalborgensis]
MATATISQRPCSDPMLYCREQTHSLSARRPRRGIGRPTVAVTQSGEFLFDLNSRRVIVLWILESLFPTVCSYMYHPGVTSGRFSVGGPIRRLPCS